jgi:D-alanyl-D-alanine carboxypeptidase
MNNATTGNPRKKILILLIIVIVVLTVGIATSSLGNSKQADSTNRPDTATSSSTGGTTKPFDMHEFSSTSASSLWVIVNKKHALTPKTYTPDLAVPKVALKGGASASNMHVSSEMAPALATMFSAAHAAGHDLKLSSGYRSYNYQVTVYNRIVVSKGQSQADTESARPGYSEHQTGLAADIAPRSGKCDLSQCFGSTPEGKWLAANAYKYGFIIRYPSDKVSITGYEYEPWHVRYVGASLSAEMHKQGIETVEEFFNVSGGTRYN